MDRNFKLLIAMFLCFFIAVTLMFITYGCASPLKKACRELTNARDKLSKAVVIAQVANQEDPNLVSEGNIMELIKLRDSVEGLMDAACFLDEIVPIE